MISYINTIRQFIPKKLNLYELRINEKFKSYSLISYVNETQLVFLDIIKKYDNLQMYLETFWDFKESDLKIMFIKSKIPKRGTATLLLLVTIINAYEKGIKTVSLDDMSDNYRKKNNIYIKLGLRYVNSQGPEMEGTTKKVYKKWNYFNKKYKYIYNF